jgi:hypothetical protein
MENTKEKPKNVKKGTEKRKGFVYPEKTVRDRIRKANVCVGHKRLLIGLIYLELRCVVVLFIHSTPAGKVIGTICG